MKSQRLFEAKALVLRMLIKLYGGIINYVHQIKERWAECQFYWKNLMSGWATGD